MTVAQAQYEDASFAGNYNIGPDESDCVTTGELVDIFCNAWGSGLKWKTQAIDQPREANFLKLDCSKFKAKFNWTPRWTVREAVEKTIDWTKIYRVKGSLTGCMINQIEEYLER